MVKYKKSWSQGAREEITEAKGRKKGRVVFRVASRIGWGGAGAPNRLFGESCLSGASSLAILFGVEAEGPPWGRTRAEMVLSTFAETKGPRRVGAKPHFNLAIGLWPWEPIH